MKIIILSMLILSSCISIRHTGDQHDVVSSSSGIKDLGVFFKDTTVDDTTISIKEDSCSKLKKHEYIKLMLCHGYVDLKKSNKFKSIKLDKPGHDLTIYFTYKIKTRKGTLDRVWNAFNLLSLTLVPYWQTRDFTVSAKVVFERDKLNTKKYILEESITEITFLPLVLAMPFTESNLAKERKLHKDLINKLLISLKRDKVIE